MTAQAGPGGPRAPQAVARDLSGRRLHQRWERSVGRAGDLSAALEALYESADLATLEPDPLQLVLGFPDPHDQEVAGFLASAWAYGRADLIVAHAGEMLRRMGDSPARFADRVAGGETALLSDLCIRTHRLHREGDWASLCWFAGDLRVRHGSIGGAFSTWLAPESSDYRPALRTLHAAWVAGGYAARVRGSTAGMRLGDTRHLLPDPSKGSACKRLNLWLRWMVRADHIDPGPWRRIAPGAARPDRLTIPLDTHIGRLGSYLGLTGRHTPDWRMAREITASLARIDARDPVRFDFALCRLGILDLCPRQREPLHCEGCPILRWCRL